MKTKLVILLITLSLTIGLNAQKSTIDNKTYKVWVSNVENSKIIRGILYEANDDSLKVIVKHHTEISIDVSKIEKIKVRRKGKVGMGALIGGLTGFLTGGLIGLISGDEPDKTVDGDWFFGQYTVEGEKAGEKALLYGTSLGIAGIGIGTIVASKKDKILINGNINNYKKQLDTLKNYSLRR